MLRRVVSIIRITLALNILMVSTPLAAQSGKLTPQQQKNLVSNLNYLQYSIAKIKASDNKAIAEDEYYSVINKLKIENINDYYLNLNYQSFLESCASLKLKQNEKDFVKQMNIKAQKTAYLNAFSNMGSVFVPGRSPRQLVASLIYSSVSNAFAIAYAKNQMQTQLEKDMFYLNQDIMANIYNMQTNLFATSAKLLGGNSSAGRLNEDSMNMFLNALKLGTNAEKLNALNEPELKKNFGSFPPFWYELGCALQNKGDNNGALECYKKFEFLKKSDVVAKDKNYINLLKNRIQICLGNDPAKVISNAQANKTEILRCISLIKSNSLDSEAGEKNVYLAKIYYLIGDTANALSCLNYLISSKTLFPEYIEEAINLKQLIMSANGSGKSPYYQNAFNYSKVKFGNETIDIDGFTEDFWDKHKVASYIFWKIPLAKDLVKKGADIIYPNRPNFVDKDHLSFIVPKQVLKGSHLSVSIDDKLYIPVMAENPKSKDEVICVIDYEVDEIDKETIVALHFDSDKNNHDVVVKYKIRPLEKKYYYAAKKAYDRIGSDAIAHNAEKVEEFGKMMYKYDYKVDDVSKLDKNIRKEQEKEGAKNNKSKAEIRSNITKQLLEKLSPDLEYLQDRSKAVEESYYKRKGAVLFSPMIVLYGEDNYVVGVYSIYDSKVGKEVISNSVGEFLYKKVSEYSLIIGGSDQIYRKAISADMSSMLQIAECYHAKGDDSESVRWLLKVASAPQKTPDDNRYFAMACKLLYDCHRQGQGVDKNTKVADFWYDKVKESGVDGILGTNEQKSLWQNLLDYVPGVKKVSE